MTTGPSKEQIEAALTRIRCNSWRFDKNANNYENDTCMEDALLLEAALAAQARELEAAREVIEAAKRFVPFGRNGVTMEVMRRSPVHLRSGGLVALGEALEKYAAVREGKNK